MLGGGGFPPIRGGEGRLGIGDFPAAMLIFLWPDLCVQGQPVWGTRQSGRTEWNGEWADGPMRGRKTPLFFDLSRVMDGDRDLHLFITITHLLDAMYRSL